MLLSDRILGPKMGPNDYDIDYEDDDIYHYDDDDDIDDYHSYSSLVLLQRSIATSTKTQTSMRKPSLLD